MRGAPVMDSRLLRIGGLDFPDFLAAARIDGKQASVERAPDHLALPHRDPTIHDATAQFHGILARDLRVVLPKLLAGLGVEGVDLAPGAGHENAAVDDDRCRLVAATALGEIAVPGEAQPAGVVGVDLFERAVALLAVIAAVGHPLARVRRGITRQQAFGIDGRV